MLNSARIICAPADSTIDRQSSPEQDHPLENSHKAIGYMEKKICKLRQLCREEGKRDPVRGWDILEGHSG